MKHSKTQQQDTHTLGSYIVGFILSVVLTFAAYLVVTQSLIPKEAVVPAILVLAVVQLFVQLFFFLHIGREKNPRWNLFTLLLAFGVVLIVVIGSLWIMYHLDYNMMSPMEIKTYLGNHEGL